MNDNQEESLSLPRFPVGAAVKVKVATMDPDFSDIPIGGWSGTIQESDAPVYLVKWNQQTIDQMDPVYRKRCEENGLDLETMWLDGNDLELDSREFANVEEPNPVIYLPLPPENQDEAEIAVPDFLGRMPFELPSSFARKKLAFKVILILVLAWATLIGTVIGSLSGSMEIARIFAASGAVVFGVLGAIVGSKLGRIFGRLKQMRSGSLWGGILGATGGGIVGAFFGAVTFAIVGVMIGSLVGALISNLVLGGRRKASSIFFGAMIGAIVQAILLNREQALVGAIYGGVIGAGVAILGIIGLKTLTGVKRRR